MSLARKKVLVTGAGGFIGSHLTERLVEIGAKVKAFVHYNSRGSLGMLETPNRAILKEVELIAGDLRDSDAVRKAVREVEIVFHLGALIGIPYSFINPRDVVDTNIGGTLNVLLAALGTNTVEKIVHTSTSEVYGSAQYVPMDEEHPLHPQSPYAASKVGADKLAESFHKSFGLPVTIIRPFNTYGPRQSARAVIPTIITQALTQEEIHLGALEPTRDFTFVSDTAEAFIKIAEHPFTVGDVFNVGSSREIAVEELAQIIIKILDKEIPVQRDMSRLRPETSEVERLCSNCVKISAKTEWQPTVELREGLEKTIDWITNALHQYKSENYNI